MAVRRTNTDFPAGKNADTNRSNSVLKPRCITGLFRSVTIFVPATIAEPVMNKSPATEKPWSGMNVAVAVVWVRVVTASVGASVGGVVGRGVGVDVVGARDVGVGVVGGKVGVDVVGCAVWPVSHASTPRELKEHAPGRPPRKQAVPIGTSVM